MQKTFRYKIQHISNIISDNRLSMLQCKKCMDAVNPA